jgi:lysophospholipase L1-like esterase
MIGYWIVMAMAACAVVAVVVVAAADEPEHRAAKPAAETGRRPIVIAALGASDATGEGTVDPERENWIAQLADQLPSDVLVQSFGIGGSWLAAAYEAQVPHAVAIEPDIVIGWLIVNDLTQGESLDNYAETLELVLGAVARPGRSIVLGNAPQLWNLPAFTGEPDDIDELRREVELWNATLVEVAVKYGVTIVDLSRDPVAVEDLSDDGFHPSPAGHAKLAATFYPQVVSAIEIARLARQERAAD